MEAEDMPWLQMCLWPPLMVRSMYFSNRYRRTAQVKTLVNNSIGEKTIKNRESGERVTKY